jgi:hypothetical protein
VRTLVISVFLLLAVKGFSQKENASSFFLFAKTIIETPVFAVKDSIRCADAPSFGGAVNLKKCRTFFYFPKDQSIQHISVIHFPSVTFYTDSLKKIKTVLWLKAYNEEILDADKSKPDLDYKTVETCLTDLFKTKGTEEAFPEIKNYARKALKWRDGSFNIVLENSVSYKKRKRKKFASIGVYIEMRPL